MNLLIIPDGHAHPDYDNQRFRALGKFILKEKPEYIVCLGDLADLPSLSSYDKGTKGFEGRRYRKDVESVINAQELLFEDTARYNARRRKNAKKQYIPKLTMCLGNHEDRISRAVNSQAELDGTIGIADLKYKEYGWNVVPFKRAFTTHGITFSHYFTTGVSGGPYQALMWATRSFPNFTALPYRVTPICTTTPNTRALMGKRYSGCLQDVFRIQNTLNLGAGTQNISGGEEL